VGRRRSGASEGPEAATTSLTAPGERHARQTSAISYKHAGLVCGLVPRRCHGSNRPDARVHLHTVSYPPPPPSRVPRSLPRGRSALPRQVVLLSQRERLIEATVDAVDANGYAATSVADIIRTAKVSRTTFYAQFRDKQECFIAAYEDRGTLQFEHVRAAAKGAAGSMQRLQAGVRAYLAVFADEPAWAQTALVEVLAAGREAAAARDSIHARYAELLRSWHVEARRENSAVPPMPDEVFACAVGGASDHLAATVRHDGPDRLPALAPVIVTFLLNVGAVPAGRDLAAALSASRARRSR